jgi:hypothetical protein
VWAVCTVSIAATISWKRFIALHYEDDVMSQETKDKHESPGSARSELRRVLVRFGVELLVYGVLLTAYFLLVLRFLSAPLLAMSGGNPWIYALVAILLIVAQGVVLDWVTSFLVEQLHLERVE